MTITHDKALSAALKAAPKFWREVRDAEKHMDKVIGAYLSSIGGVVCLREPAAWIVPGTDNARSDGSLDAMAWKDGEFSRPLHTPIPEAGNGGDGRAFAIGDSVRKTKGSSWHGEIVGFYSTKLTPVGYCVESEREPGSIQIYPESALEATPSHEGREKA